MLKFCVILHKYACNHKEHSSAFDQHGNPITSLEMLSPEMQSLTSEKKNSNHQSLRLDPAGVKREACGYVR